MKNVPKVSIAIMCYNQENFIRDTIESCLAQTYPNIQICISDDCSTDNTYSIILEYKRKYGDKIQCFQQPKNMGTTSYCINANSMLDMCDADYVALLDGDDIMLPYRIEKQVQFLEKNPDCIGVSGWMEAFDNRTGKILGNIHRSLRVQNRTPQTLIEYGNSVPPCLMFRNTKTIRYNTRLKIMGDWLFYTELSILGKIGHLDEVLGKYRIHENNSVHKDLFPDHWTTHEIIKEKYPQFSESLTRGEANLYIARSLGMIKKREYIKGLSSFAKGMRIAPIFGLKKVIYFINQHRHYDEPNNQI